MNPFLKVNICIPSKYVFSMPASSFDSVNEPRFILAAHIHWVRDVIKNSQIPQTFPLHDQLTDDEIQAFLSQGKSEPLGPSWMFLHLTVVKVSSCMKYYRDFENEAQFKSSVLTTSVSSSTSTASSTSTLKPLVQQNKLTWPQLLDFVGASNFNYLWEQPYISFLSSKNESSSSRCSAHESSFEEIKTTEKNYLCKLLSNLYPNATSSFYFGGDNGGGSSNSSRNEGTDDDTSRFTTSISSLSQPLSVIVINSHSSLTKSSTTESSTSISPHSNISYFFCFYPFVAHTLQDCIKFSPYKLNSHLKYLFICYQILQFIRDFRDTNIPIVSDLNLNDFRTDECLYLSIVPRLSHLLNFCEISSDQRLRLKKAKTPATADENILSLVKMIVQHVRKGGIAACNSPIFSPNPNTTTEQQQQLGFDKKRNHLDAKKISSTISHWCEGLISNYDYLMFINFLSGRICDGNPNFHPVFPWILCEKEESGSSQGYAGGGFGWRDLTKSKFRINKGERQLDLMYEEASEHNSVPHHVTDILSEITYYVYKARQTPKTILCKFVRPKWVPAEYPVSIQRMQEWTPDECIPEFYDDPSIFKSIHPDLEDLQVPKWSKSPEDFIIQHRQLLESDAVSSKLHHWIDLTFGYKLSGNAAVRSKNIYLALADNHQNLEKSGILQIFHTPHPPRRCKLRESKNLVTYAELKRMRESDPIDDSGPTLDCGPNYTSTITSTTSLINPIPIPSISPSLSSSSSSILNHPRSPTKPGLMSGLGSGGINTNLSTGSSINQNATGSASSSSVGGGGVGGSSGASSVWKTITLPKHYDPMGFLNDFEVSLNFFRSHFNEEDLGICLRGLKTRGDEELCPMVKLFGCLLVELTLSPKLYHFSSVVYDIEERFAFYKKALSSRRSSGSAHHSCNLLESVPLFAKRAIKAIFLPHLIEYSIPMSISIDFFLLGDRLSPLSFPRYFPEVFKMVRTLRNFDGILQTAEPSDTNLRVKVQQIKVKSFSRDLISILHLIDEDGLDIILPYVTELFHHPETRVLAVWNLFCPMSRAIGRKKSIETLLQPIVTIYESDYHSEKHLKLFHRSFLLQLMSCFGLQVFLENFATLLIEALGGWKNSGSNSSSAGQYGDGTKGEGGGGAAEPRAHLNSTDILEMDINIKSPPSASSGGGNLGSRNPSAGLNSRFTHATQRSDSEQSGIGGGGGGQVDTIEAEMFLFEPETSASDYENDTVGNNNNSSSTSQNQNRGLSRSPSLGGGGGDTTSAKSLNISDDINIIDEEGAGASYSTSSLTVASGGIGIPIASGEKRTSVPISVSGSEEQQEQHRHRRPSSSSKSTNSDISEMCCESIVWLAHRLGPVLSAKFLTRNLLRMLTLCYYGHFEGTGPSTSTLSSHQQQQLQNPNNFTCDGDEYSNRVLECLIAISDLYGDCFIERQYIPYSIDLIHSATVKKMNGSVEAAIVGVGSLLERIFVHMPDALLLAQLKDPLINAVLSPLVSFICTDSPIFPSGALPRALLATKTLAMLNSIRRKIGPDLSQVHLKPLVLQICSTFNAIFSGGSQDPELRAVFGPSLAHDAYTSFCDLILGTEYEQLIRDLYLKYGVDNNMSPAYDVAASMEKSLLINKGRRSVQQQSSSFGSRSFGNRIQIQEPEVNTEPESPIEPPAGKKDTTRHLRGNWLSYWDWEIGRFETKFDFKQIKLQNFVGHNAAVRSIYVLNNENSFLTASKDKTVKLYSLRNQADEVTTAKWTYGGHKKPVLSVIFNEELHLAASTDGFIHVWDPFVGKTVRILDQRNTKGIICSLKNNENSFVAAGIDSSIHVVDPRTCHSYELKIGIGQNSGLVRCMSISPSHQFVSVGHSSGMISTLDLRNGTLLGSWKAHEGEILQLMSTADSNRLISSSFDQNISVWNMDENRLAFHMRGPTEPVHSISSYENELITCTTSNRIGVHSYIDPNSDFSSTRLRSDTFKGIVTTMTLLPLNQVLLVGSDSGTVTLLC